MNSICCQLAAASRSPYTCDSAASYLSMAGALLLSVAHRKKLSMQCSTVYKLFVAKGQELWCRVLPGAILSELLDLSKPRLRCGGFCCFQEARFNSACCSSTTITLPHLHSLFAAPPVRSTQHIRQGCCSSCVAAAVLLAEPLRPAR